MKKKTEVCYCTDSELSIPHYMDDHESTLEQDTDKLVAKYGFDRNEQHYGALSEVEDDDELNDMRETLLDFLEKGMKEEYINKLHLLLEVEYQLSSREGQ
jgi:hypothetical protein